jgi:hypothetical protein
MRYEFVELVESLVSPEARLSDLKPSVLVITKAGKYLRGHIKDHNVRINSDGRVRGRLVMLIDSVEKNVDANDVTSLEKIL